MEEIKEIFYCDCCKCGFSTNCNLKAHLLTQKHIANIQNKNIAINMEKIKVYCCDHCDKFYKSKQSLNNHKLKIDKMMLVKQIHDNTVKENNDLKKIVNDSLLIAKQNSQTAKKSMNILTYAKLYLKDGKPINMLNDDDLLQVIKYKNPENNEMTNEIYVKTAVHKFNHHIFHSFVGDMIVEYYKPKTKMSANLISTDTSRLSFIIMQKITKGKIEKKEWINDKSGKKFTEFVLTPVIDAVKQTLVEFIEFKKTKEFNEGILCLMAKCVELKRDIEVKKFTNQILKYVAPHFHFDNLKLLDDADYMDDTDNVDLKIINEKIRIIKKSKQ